jgi:hypothetical protein
LESKQHPAKSAATDLFSVDFSEHLLALADGLTEEFRTAAPFPHIAIDDWLPDEPLRRALAEFPRPGDREWQRFASQDERKLAFNFVEQLPPALRDILFFLNSATILQFLERVTGIKGLIPDPYFAGGGLHQIERGGHLGIHADFNVYERLRLDRRLNLLLYLNEDWLDPTAVHAGVARVPRGFVGV